MTIEEAFMEFLNSPAFKDIAKRQDIPDGGRYRQYKKRFIEGKLSKDIIIELLEGNGYVISANKARKKN
jgi:hypothetical protein